MQQTVYSITSNYTLDLNTDVGRFMTRDTWAGEYNRQLSLNKWNYVEWNPINFTDPSGEIPVIIDYVLDHKQDFENNKSFIKIFGLHPTTVAAGIAV